MRDPASSTSGAGSPRSAYPTPASRPHGSAPSRLHLALWGSGAVILVLILCGASLFIGADTVRPLDLWQDSEQRMLLVESRLPRTASLLLSGMAMSVAGLMMQTITRNRFIEPATAGTLQFAALGLLLAAIFIPQAPVWVTMLTASVLAFVGSMLFMVFISRVEVSSSLLVPLTGIMLGAVVGALVQYIALQANLTQMLTAWESGSFTSVIRGRYELLWIGMALTLVIFLFARRFAVLTLGRDLAENLGVNYRVTVLVGLALASLITGQVVAVIGYLPFLGLIVPNVVSLLLGDNTARTLPWVCLFGGGIVVACDIIGRLIRAPSEIPAGVVLGVIGAGIFIVMILRGTRDR